MNLKQHNNIAIILAAGDSTRMGNKFCPKPFIKLKNKEIVLHCIETFLSVEDIEWILVCFNKKHQQYIDILQNKIKSKKFLFCYGGKNRIDSFIKSIHYLTENKLLTNDSNIITHDGARPFVSKELINKHITSLKKHSVINTILPITDSLVNVSNDLTILSYLDREKCFSVQTPQSFQFHLLNNIDFSLLVNDSSITDLCNVFYKFKFPIYNVLGEKKNYKITIEEDLNFF